MKNKTLCYEKIIKTKVYIYRHFKNVSTMIKLTVHTYKRIIYVQIANN